MLRVLTAAHIRQAVPMRAAIEAMRAGFSALSTGRASVPLRISLSTPGGLTLLMPAHIHGSATSAVKIVSVNGDNPRRGLPMIHASVLVLDAETGRTLALLDGAYLTALRTGAASGLATQLLARSEASVLGVVGAGVQARSQVEAVLAVRPVKAVRVYGRHGSDAFCAEMGALFPAVRFTAALNAHQALYGADVLIAATTSSTPVVHAADVSPGAHINGIGSYTPAMQEVDGAVVANARIVVDSRQSCLAEAGDLLIPIRQGLLHETDIYAELGEIAAGLKPGRQYAEEITFFKSVGNAVQDAAVAALALQAAEANNLGALIAF